MRLSNLIVGAVASALILTGCSSSAAPANDDGPGAITVFAAASLTESFTEIGALFKKEHPGSTVTFAFEGSSALAQKINDGAPADVFAAASPETMRLTTKSEAVADSPEVFVTNRLQIAVPEGNPAGITGLADFADDDLLIGLCAEEVPCGAAALRAFESAEITPKPDTLEKDVKAVLTKVRLGELDAALVYRTDVIAADDEVDGIDFLESANAINYYPIAVCAQAPNPDLAARFVAFVLSDAGQAVLTAAGFDSP